MPQVELRDEGVKLPSSVRKAMNLRDGDTLDMNVEEGKIVLVPHVVSSVVTQTDDDEIPSDLLAMIGANAGSGLYKNAQEVDDYIRELRKEWD